MEVMIAIKLVKNSTILKKQTGTVITHTRTSQEVVFKLLPAVWRIHLLPLNFFRTSKARIQFLEDLSLRQLIVSLHVALLVLIALPRDTQPIPSTLMKSIMAPNTIEWFEKFKMRIRCFSLKL